MTGRCTRWERWLPESGGGLKLLNWNLHSFQLSEIIQVVDSISWVRCASGNVYKRMSRMAFTRFCWPNLELMQVEPPLAGEITQVLDAIPWVRCASGNVLGRCSLGQY